MKTALRLFAIVIMAIIVFALAGCDNPAMEQNQTEYMYSDLGFDKVEWEIVPGMSMTDMYITLAFDEPVRVERAADAWRPFTVTYDYMGELVTKNPNVNTPFTPSDRGSEKTVYRFSFMVTSGDTADMFSNVKLSYNPPMGDKIVTAFGDELKMFENKSVTKKETGGGMGGM
jgi:hypothetical protein